MYKLIGVLIVAVVLLVGAFFLGYVVGTTVSPLQQPVESTTPTAVALGVLRHG